MISFFKIVNLSKVYQRVYSYYLTLLPLAAVRYGDFDDGTLKSLCPYMHHHSWSMMSAPLSTTVK